MFGLFKKDPLKKLQKEYEAKLEEAMHMQRNGKIREYSFLSLRGRRHSIEDPSRKSRSEKLGSRQIHPVHTWVHAGPTLFKDRVVINHFK